MILSFFRPPSTFCPTLALVLVVCSHALAAQDTDNTNLDISKGKITVTGLPQRPKVGKDVVTVLKEAGTYTTFLKLADQAGLTPILKGTERDSAASADVTFQQSAVPQISSSDLKVQGQLPPGMDMEQLRSKVMDMLADKLPQAVLHSDQITVFAPTDAAFRKLSKATQDSLQSNPDLLLTLLRGHLVNVGIDEPELRMIKDVQTLSGTTLSVTPVTAASPKISGVTIVKSTYGDNGTIYGIDTVIRH